MEYKDWLANLEITEAMGGYRALELVTSLGLKRANLEGDTLTVIRAINSLEDDLSYIGEITESSKKLGGGLEAFSCTHTRQTGNAVAHALASRAPSSRLRATASHQPSSLLPEPGSSRLHRALPNINGRTAPLPRRTSAVRDASSDHHRRLSPPSRTAVRRSTPGSGNFGGHRTGPDSGEEVPLFSLSLVPPQPSENHAGGCITNPKILIPSWPAHLNAH
ncbi:hypothetical protein U1Q18_011735 [Sarracenia purpurea var. burkii]